MREPEGRLLEEVSLTNGLRLFFYDQSRPIPGGNWQVQLLIHIPLELKKDYFRGHADPQSAYEKLAHSCGTTLAFRQTKVRNFISEDRVGSVLGQMKEEFLQSGLMYVSSPAFAQKAVLRKFAESESQRYPEIARRSQAGS